MVSFYLGTQNCTRGVVDIHRVVFPGEPQRKGHGTAILKHLITLYQNADALSFRITVASTRGRRLYTNCGFNPNNIDGLVLQFRNRPGGAPAGSDATPADQPGVAAAGPDSHAADLPAGAAAKPDATDRPRGATAGPDAVAADRPSGSAAGPDVRAANWPTVTPTMIWQGHAFGGPADESAAKRQKTGAR